jgi:hypothetical protein
VLSQDQMTPRSRPRASADPRRRSPEGDQLSDAISAYLSRRQAEQLPMPQRRGRAPRRTRGWPTLAITALPIFAVASFVLFVVV